MKHIIAIISLFALSLATIGCGGDDTTTESAQVGGKKVDPTNPGSTEEAGGQTNVDPL